LDLFVGNSGGVRFLYRNNGDGTFEKITTGSLVTDVTFITGTSWADFDNDGLIDAFTANNGGIEQDNSLYKNTGDATFAKITTGIVVNDGGNSKAGVWADYDNDGDMDLYVVHRLFLLAGLQRQNSLYRNDGGGNFTKLTSGIGPIVTDNATSFDAQWADFDNDLDLDVLVVNRDFIGLGFHNLYSNNGNGTFTSINPGGIFSTGVLTNGGLSWGDYDNDGDLDLFLTNFGTNLLYRNDGNGSFTQITSEIVTNDVVVESLAPTWVDFDNDGDLDLHVANDFTGGGPNDFLYTNNGNSNHFLTVELRGVTTNASAIGARVFAYTTIFGNPVSQMREITSQSRGKKPLRQHFGLGDATTIDSLIVVWPTSGIVQKFFNVAADQFIKIREDDTNITVTTAPACKPDFPPVNPGFITGNIVADIDSDCVFNFLPDYFIPNKLVQALPGPNFVFTDGNGNYEFRLAPDNYAVSQVDETGNIFEEENCPSTDPIYFVNVASGGSTPNNDFFNIQKPAPCGINVNVALPGGIAPCFNQVHQVCVTFDNTGPAIQNPNFTINTASVPPGVTVVAGSITTSGDCNCTPTLVGNDITCSNTGIFPANGSCTICFDVDVPLSFPNNPAGSITTTASVSGTCQNNPFSSSDSSVDSANCAVDPNDKMVNPKGCGPLGNIARGEELVYQVRFQNTGSAPANKVEIRDVLDSDLDLTTFRLMATSHTVTRVEIIPGNALIITFDNINLPDSGANLAGSQGFVVFGITPQTGLSDGTEITNQAGIYFDRNEVVLTNTTLNTIRDNPFPIADFETNHSCTSTGLEFDFTYTGGTADGATYAWSFGANATPNTSTDENPTGIVFSGTGTEQITLIVTRFGCVDAITKIVEVEDVNCGNNKVLICHNPSGKEGNSETICINQNALAAHLAHGDCIGSCNSPLARMGNTGEGEKVEINPPHSQLHLRCTPTHLMVQPLCPFLFLLMIMLPLIFTIRWGGV